MRRVLVMLGLMLPILVFAAPALEWVTTYDGGGNYVDTASQALTDPSGNLIVGGSSHDGAEGSEINVCKYDRADGTLMWEARLSAYDHVSDMSMDGMAWDGSGDILVAGRLLGCGTG